MKVSAEKMQKKDLKFFSQILNILTESLLIMLKAGGSSGLSIPERKICR